MYALTVEYLSGAEVQSTHTDLASLMVELDTSLRDDISHNNVHVWTILPLL